MTKPELSWQGIGISSNPNQKIDPLSVHLLNYLREASAYSDQHLIIIGDSIQAQNYVAIYGLELQRAKEIAKQKGERRKKDLTKICQANDLPNISVKTFEESGRNEDIFRRIQELYFNNPEIRQAVLSTIPSWLKKKTSHLDLLANYSLEEIALILSLEGIKFGHGREKGYDELALKIHQEFAIGMSPEFYYSSQGLEHVPGTKRNIEPYSSLVSPKRLLLTDSKRRFMKKANEIKEPNEFYDENIRPTYKRFTRPKRIIRALSVAATFLGLVLGTYVHQDTRMIRQEQFNQIPPFALTGDYETAVRETNNAIDRANRIIEDKYLIPDYFETNQLNH